MDVFRGLLHDTSADPSAHAAALGREDGWAVGPLVVGDERLAGLDADVALSVVTSGGAGSVAALGRRADGLRLVAVETVLRDLDDVAGNASRVVAARAELPDAVDVYVTIPAGAHGFVDAVEVVEAAGLLGRVDLAAGALPAGVAEALSVLVEADLPFKVTGAGRDPLGPYGVVPVLMVVEALVDGADPQDAVALLGGDDPRRVAHALAGWDAPTQARVRRRLRGVDCSDVAAALDRLGAAGVLEGKPDASSPGT